MPTYNDGDRVRVTVAHPPGHRRVPYYIRGKTGEIERYCGTFPNPEELAYGFYRVRFMQKDIWPDYGGADGDSVDLEIQEHWLSPA